MLKISIAILVGISIYGIGAFSQSGVNVVRPRPPTQQTGQRISREESLQRLLSAKRTQAQDILVKAIGNPKTSARASAIYSRLLDQLATVKINSPVPGAADYLGCPGDGVYTQFGEIFFCASEVRTYPHSMAQAIIHELAHLTKIDRELAYDLECAATMVELSAMNNAGLVPEVNQYMKNRGEKRHDCSHLRRNFIITDYK